MSRVPSTLPRPRRRARPAVAEDDGRQPGEHSRRELRDHLGAVAGGVLASRTSLKGRMTNAGKPYVRRQESAYSSLAALLAP